jgi:hypothetical protein
MKSNKILFISSILASAVLFGCASNHKAYRSDYSPSSSTRGIRAEDGNTAGTDVLGTVKDPDRIMLYNASVSISTKKPDTIQKKVIALAKKYDGYMLSTGSYSTVIRVKAENLKSAVADVEKMGKVKSKSIYADDVTDDYKDNVIRLDNAEKARTRYLELLQKAVTVEETIKVEKELERLNTEIDLYKGKQLRMNHLEEYSTLTVYIKKKHQLGPLGYVAVGLWKVVKVLFVIK